MREENNNSDIFAEKEEIKDEKKNSKKRVLKTSKYIYEDIEGKFLHIKVGTEEKPAGNDQISEIRNKITELLEKNNVNCLVFVTHHAVSIDIL